MARTGIHDALDVQSVGADVEDVSSLIKDISPVEVPFQSRIGTSEASNTLHKFETHDLADAAQNAYEDGEDIHADESTDTEKLGNHCQISRKAVVVSGRADKIKKHGRSNEREFQEMKRGLELKRDMEFDLMSNNAAEAETEDASNGNSPISAGAPAWLRTNTSRGVSGADPAAYTSGVPLAAATDGDLRALTEANFKSVLQEAYTAGGSPRLVFMKPTIKQRFSEFIYERSEGNGARAAVVNVDMSKSEKGGGIVAQGAIDYYRSDFGVLELIPDRFQRERDVFIIDPDCWAVAYLRRFQSLEIARTGDARKRLLLVDYTLESLQEKSSGIVADIQNVGMTQ